MIHSLIEAIGWTLVHSLWQWGLIALIWVGLEAAFRQQSAQFRYVCLAILFAMGCLASIGTLGWVYEAPTGFSAEVVSHSGAENLIEFQQGARLGAGIGAWQQSLSPYLPVLSFAWLLGVLLMSLRMGTGLWYLHQLRYQNLESVPASWKNRFQELTKQLGLPAGIQLFVSKRVDSPLTLGHFKPIVLIPVGMLTQLSPDQIDMILTHELAHIHRSDYLFNLIQSLIEIVFFYHPAVWWISREIRQEREACCDDLTVASCGDAFVYASALTQVQVYRSTFQSQLTMNATGLKHSFTRRIQRLMGVRQRAQFSFSSFFLTAFIACLGLGFGYQLYATAPGLYDIPTGEPHTWTITPDISWDALDQIREDMKDVTSDVWLDDFRFRGTDGMEHLHLYQRMADGDIKAIKISNFRQFIITYDPGQQPDPLGVSVIEGEWETKRLTEEAYESGEIEEVETETEIIEGVRIRLPQDQSLGKEPLYLINGKAYRQDQLQQLDLEADEIQQVDVRRVESVAPDLEPEREVIFVEEIPNIEPEREVIFVEEIPIEPKMTQPAAGVVIRGNAVLVEQWAEEPVEFLKEDLPTVKQGEEITLDKDSEFISEGPEPLFVVDGQVFTKAEFEELNLPPNTIKQIDVLKGPSAIALYGEAGKNGVVVIHLKDDALESLPPSERDGYEIRFKGLKNKKKANKKDQESYKVIMKGVVIIHNGEVLRPDLVKHVKHAKQTPGQIEVLKGQKAQELYGVDKAVLVKGNVKETIIEEVPDGPDPSHNLLIDDEPGAWSELEQLSSDGIERMEVWKGEKAVELQLEKGLTPTPTLTLIYTKKGPDPHPTPDPQPTPLPAADYSLKAVPNGFSDLTEIHFQLTEQTKVQLQVFDSQGKFIRSLQNGSLKAGSHRVTLSSQGLTPGTYLVQLQTAKGSQSTRVVLQE